MEQKKRSGGMAGARSNRACSAFEWMVLSVWLFAPAAMATESYEVTVERNVAAKMRDGVDAARGYLPAEGGGEVSRPVGAHALRQNRDAPLWVAGGGAGLRGDRARRARALRIGGGVVHLQV